MTKKSFEPQQIGDERPSNPNSTLKVDDPSLPLTGKPPSIQKKIWISLLTLIIGISFLVAAIVIGLELTPNNNNNQQPNQIVQKYSDNATMIIDYMTKGDGRGQGFDWIANITDTFGPRKAGTEALENAIMYLIEKMKQQNFSNVHNQSAIIPRWIRGEESALLTVYSENSIPTRNKSLTILGLGSTKATPPDGILADVVVVQSFDELDKLGSKGINGTIVVYNNPWVNYDVSVQYRTEGAKNASQYGAVAALIRSAASFSINSPHTGSQDLETLSSYSSIPAVSITVEDAEMMYRIQKRGQRMTVLLKINSTIDGNATIHNTIFELTGSTYPNEIVMVSGHLDSWDVGQGAMDNAAGASLAWQTITTLTTLGLTPKRTIRGIFWTAEEQGHVGSAEYYYQTANNTKESYVFLMESDEGLFPPMNLAFAGTEDNMQIFQQLIPLVSSLNVTSVVPGDLGDATLWNVCKGVPGIFLNSIDAGYEKYFAFHHSNGDMPNVYTPEEVDTAGALFTVLAYVMADMDDILIPANVTKPCYR